MEPAAWIIWIILGVVLIIAEIFTLGFVLFWFGIGALAAAFAGWLGFGLAIQFLVFAGVSVALTGLSRTIFARTFALDKSKEIKTGMDSLPGQIGTVTAASTGARQEAAVKVFGSTWTAFPVDETDLIEGEKVEVVRVQGSSIYVQKLDAPRSIPEWRQE